MVLADKMVVKCSIANSGYKYARVPVLGPNDFWINTKRFIKVLTETVVKTLLYTCIQARSPVIGLNEFYSRTKRFKKHSYCTILPL